MPEPTYHCSKCFDTGIECHQPPGGSVPVGVFIYGGYSYGLPQRLVVCVCAAGEQRERDEAEFRVHYLRQKAEEQRARQQQRTERFQASLPPIYQGLTLDGYPHTTRRQVEVVAALRGWLDTIRARPDPSTWPWPYIWGLFGTGKSTLACAATTVLLHEGLVTDALYVLVPDLIDAILAAQRRDPEAEPLSLVLRRVREAGLVVLDEVGRSSSSAWANEMLGSVLAHRHNHGRVTLLVSNVSPDETAKAFGRYLAGRLRQRCLVIDTKGCPDLRERLAEDDDDDAVA